MGNSLVRYLESQCGESLRGIARYDRSDFDVLHHRRDLNRQRVAERVSAIHENITWEWNPTDEMIESELGRKHATLQVRHEAIIVDLVATEEDGYLISLEPTAAQKLTGFLDDCLEYV